MIGVKELIKILKDNKELNAYEIVHIKKESSELFFVLQKLEINRATNTENLSVKLYVDKDDKRGSSTFIITNADDEKSINKKINDTLKKAKTALNPYYPLCLKGENINKKIVLDEPLNTTALKVADAIFKADKFKEGFINSTEIFVSKTSIEFYNSNGVKQKDEKFAVEFEIIPTWSNKKEEFELYDYCKYSKLNTRAITLEVNHVLELSKYRSEAKTLKEVKLPKKLPILIYDEMANLIVDTIMSNASYMNFYMHTAHYALKDIVSLNKFDLTLKGNIEGVFDSSSFDGNGVLLSSKRIIKDGVLKDNYGDIRFGHYLNVKNPSGNYRVALIKAEGSEYEKEPHLIIDRFSSPQMEETSGYFGGEVRLARYFDGEKYIPLTSFSVSGNIYEALKNIRFSKEQCVTTKYKGPKYFIFDDLKIS